MVILSVLLAAVANVAVHSINNVIRSDAGVTSAAIAQDSIERLMSAPVSTWAFDNQGRVKKGTSSSMIWGDGRRYKIDRQIEPVSNPYRAIDACDVVVGQSTSAADLIKVTIGVTPIGKNEDDRYESVYFLNRDDDTMVAESSLTVRSNVAHASGRKPYHESMNGGIQVVLGKGSTQRAATTQKGCVTFVGLRAAKMDLSFKTKTFKESLSGLTNYKEIVHLVKGGHRLVEFDLLPQREFMIIPRLMGPNERACLRPRLLRTRMVLKAAPNRGTKTIAEIAQEAHNEFEKLNAIPQRNRTPALDMRLQSGSRWQYYIQCRPTQDGNGQRQEGFLHLLPDSIPISLVTDQGNTPTIRPIATWADSTFKASEHPHVEEGEWPVITIPDAASGETQSVMAGSCVMNRSEERGVLVNVAEKAESHWKANMPRVVRVPMWPASIDGIEQPPSNIRSYDSTYSLVIKQVFDDGKTKARFGDSSIRNQNLDLYSGCKDTPVFHVGWLNRFDGHHDRQQVRLLLPYGLYTYAFYTPDQTEKNEHGNTVMRSRHSCDGTCNHAKGESQCIRSGAEEYNLYDFDGRNLLWALTAARTFDSYVDWEDRTVSFFDPGGNTPRIPRGPIIEGCPAYQND